MKVGDLAQWKHTVAEVEKIGIVTHVWEDGYVDVLFNTGEVCILADDIEVMNENR